MKTDKRDIHEYFGLTYAKWLVLPRVILQEMPIEWQNKFAKALEELHPDIVKTTWKFKRWHHQVNYKPFKKNKLIRRAGIQIPEGINNYGMILTEI